jgi:phospholipid-transporting ATPase
LSADNIVLRGCTLKNTDWVEGVVIFTGHDTKLMRNSAQATHKFSRLERSANLAVVVILALQLTLATIAASVGFKIEVN